MARRFHSREPAADHHCRQQPSALGVVGLGGCLLKTRDNFVAQVEAVAYGPECVGMGSHAGNLIEIDIRATGENQVSIGKCRPLAVRACVLNLVLLQINAGYRGRNPGRVARDLSAWHHYVERGKRTARHLREHRRKNHVVFIADNYDLDVRSGAATELLSQGCTCESPAHDDDFSIFHGCNLLVLPPHAQPPAPPAFRLYFCGPNRSRGATSRSSSAWAQSPVKLEPCMMASVLGFRLASFFKFCAVSGV